MRRRTRGTSEDVAVRRLPFLCGSADNCERGSFVCFSALHGSSIAAAATRTESPFVSDDMRAGSDGRNRMVTTPYDKIARLKE